MFGNIFRYYHPYLNNLGNSEIPKKVWYYIQVFSKIGNTKKNLEKAKMKDQGSNRRIENKFNIKPNVKI